MSAFVFFSVGFMLGVGLTIAAIVGLAYLFEASR